MNFDYRVSVIIPVYNRGHLVNIAFDSLRKQTINFNDMQIIIVNDGSTDNSLEVCREYEKQYSNVLVLDKKNGGLSSTRNYGMKHAAGKYIMFLDDDDEYTPETVKSVVDFFDEHYDYVDLVTYKIVYYTGGKRARNLHYRYKILTESGVYDLNNNPMIVQTTINVCVKNRFDKNATFRETPNFYMEDQAFNNEMVSEKMRIGYCENGEYIYNQHAGSIVSSLSYPYYCFENFIAYFEELYAKYDCVPPYYQCMFLHNLYYRLTGNRLFPYHYSDEDFAVALGRISNLLNKVDDKILLTFTPLDQFYRVYFFNLKTDRKAIVRFFDDRQTIGEGDEVYISRETATIAANRFYFKDKKMRIVGYVRSPFFVYLDKPVLYAKDMSTGERIDIELYESSHCYYYCEHKCAKNWSFDFEMPLNKSCDIKFFVESAGSTCEVAFEFRNTVSAFRSLRNAGFAYVKDGILLKYQYNYFTVRLLSKSKRIIHALRHSFKLFCVDPKFVATYWAAKLFKRKKIWLYNDNLYMLKDNGYYQFCHDIQKNDGVKRYLIYDGSKKKAAEIFTREQQKHLIRFASMKHKLYYIACSKILSSFCEESSFTPLINSHRRLFFDIIEHEVIYLQHGILHATTPTKYSKDRVFVDRVVVSSNFELKNFVDNYGYNQNDLIPSGMARYDYTALNQKPKNLILYAPSWRDKLIGKYINRAREYNDSVLTKSTYFKGILAYLKSPELYEALKKYDVYLDFKPHPNFRGYIHNLDGVFNDRIRLAAPSVKLEDYSLFITDFSSYNFDFIYQGRQLMYYVPDYAEFKSGCVTFYRDLDLKFEDGFGDYAQTAQEAVNLTLKRIESGFKSEEKYQKRIDAFFLEKGNHCERLYQELMKDTKTK